MGPMCKAFLCDSDVKPRRVEITCACGCGRKKKVRQADIDRGWGKFFNKSCKAREQTRRIGLPYLDCDDGLDHLCGCGDR